MYYSNTVVQPNINTNLSEMERIERKRLTGSYELPDPNTPYTIRAGIYIRVSTGPQANDDKASIPEQRRAAMEVIEHNKWALIREYQDIEATSYEESPLSREGLSNAIRDAENALYDVLLVWIDSRLGRNSEEVGMIRKSLRELGVQIYSVKKPLQIIDPRFYNPKIDRFRRVQEGIYDLMSDNESAEFSAKMQFGKMKKALDGNIPSRVPFGYKKKKKIAIVNGKEKVISEVVPDNQQLAIVKEIFDLYLNQGYGIRKICGILNAKNALAPRNGKWNYSTVRYTLKNPTYAGKVRWGWKLSDFRRSKQRLSKGYSGVIVNGHHLAIITEEDFVKVQKKTEIKAQLGGRAVASQGLLVGLLKCKLCGGGAYITSSPSMYAYKMEKMGKPKDRFSKIHYYVCSTVSKYGSTACKRYICGQKRVEELIVNEIRNLANSKEAQKTFEKTLKTTNNDGAKLKESALNQELKKNPQKRERYTRIYGEKIITYDEYCKLISELNESEVKLRDNLLQFQRENKTNEIMTEKLTKAVSLFRNFDKIWEGAGFEVKKDLLRSVIKKIVYSKNKVFIEYQI